MRALSRPARSAGFLPIYIYIYIYIVTFQLLGGMDECTGITASSEADLSQQLGRSVLSGLPGKQAILDSSATFHLSRIFHAFQRDYDVILHVNRWVQPFISTSQTETVFFFTPLQFIRGPFERNWFQWKLTWCTMLCGWRSLTVFGKDILPSTERQLNQTEDKSSHFSLF